jgi:hypothetical protein
MRHSLLLILGLLTIGLSSSIAQPLVDTEIVEVSGIVITRAERGRISYVPFTTVHIANTQRGTYANYEGMFSIVVKKGQTVTFSTVGFADYELTVPKDYPELHYSVTVELQPKEYNMDDLVIFPWPDRDNFRAEFLAMSATNAQKMEDIAKDNLDRRRMLEVGNAMNMDGKENAMMYLQNQASSYSYAGQVRPMPIFNPIAWAQLFQQWQNKKKKKRDDD